MGDDPTWLSRRVAGATNGATCPTDSSRSHRDSIRRQPLEPEPHVAQPTRRLWLRTEGHRFEILSGAFLAVPATTVLFPVQSQIVGSGLNWRASHPGWCGVRGRDRHCNGPLSSGAGRACPRSFIDNLRAAMRQAALDGLAPALGSHLGRRVAENRPSPRLTPDSRCRRRSPDSTFESCRRSRLEAGEGGERPREVAGILDFVQD
jgi:hypothetical protein